MFKVLILLICLPFTWIGFGDDEIDFNDKRLLSGLKKKNISGLMQLEPVNISKETLNPAQLQGKFFKTTGNEINSEVKYVYVGRVNSCRTGGCSVSGNSAVNIESEYFDYFIFFDSRKTVIQVEVFNYQATHGYEITAKGWLKQFTGFSGKDSLEVNKNIDSISGATVSVYAITTDVQEKTRLLKSML